ncbi:MAG TPA: quinol:electron acceptor oxidoreductase subunit ActD [Blastocatellia bacterium]|nr:quinol:electron acceptor oxidoreductase subunit ActD [Blastocatellia bacterium]
MTESNLYGLLAEFDDPKALVEAARKVSEAGYKRIEAYTPLQVPELSEIIPVRRGVLPLVVFAGGAIGTVVGFLMQYYASAVDYPLNIGGRPLNSWVAFVPLTFELAVLGAAVGALFGMLVLSRLPQPSHPIFSNKRFTRATQDGFFLCVESADPKFNREEVKRLLERLAAVEVFDVENTIQKKSGPAKAKQVTTFLFLLGVLCLCSRCTHTMADQPKPRPLGPSNFFPDNQSARPTVPGTVAHGYQEEDSSKIYVYKSGEAYVDTIPFPVTPEIADQGRQRYEIYCSVCHGRDGSGDGPVVEKGFTPPLSFYSQEVRQKTAGFYFDVITNGYHEMGRFSYLVSERDRWSIIAYMRYLQQSNPARDH